VCLRTIRWPLVGDTSLIHYAVFLMDTGAKPYVDFREVNMPGAYLLDWFVMHTLGPGALAERIYDLVLCAAALLAMVYLCPRRFRFAGFFAGCMFFLIHMRDGPRQTGQRDLSLAVFALVALALSFAAKRTGRSWIYFLSGIMLGAGVMVKPVALVFAVPLIIGPMGCAVAGVAILLLAAGFLVPLALTAGWLMYQGALPAFLTTGLMMMQYHASLAHLPLLPRIARGFSPLLPLVLAGVILAPFLWKRLRSWEFSGMCWFTVAAFLCYTVQGKGYPYQRYSFVACLLLTLGLIFTCALEEGAAWQRWFGACALGVACLGIGPLAARRAIAYQPQLDQFGTLLSNDLNTLGTEGLRNKVQCLDTFSGCIRVLYDLRLKQSTGTVYDEFLFSRSNSPAIANSRAAFRREIAAGLPEAIIVTPQFYSAGTDTYDKVSSWPSFAKYLSDNYWLYVERTPTKAEFWEGSPRVPAGYRIYLRKTARQGHAHSFAAE
jgi:hypothetical protein